MSVDKTPDFADSHRDEILRLTGRNLVPVQLDPEWFMIPGMPKDVFTYLVPLTNMSYKRFITLTSIGRVPGIVGSAYAASGFANGEIVGPTVVMVLLVVLAILAAIFSERILNALAREGAPSKGRAR